MIIGIPENVVLKTKGESCGMCIAVNKCRTPGYWVGGCKDDLYCKYESLPTEGPGKCVSAGNDRIKSNFEYSNIKYNTQ